jgi:hypothetical protein
MEMVTTGLKIAGGLQRSNNQIIGRTLGSNEGENSMPCDTKFRPGQTLTERKEEVKKAVSRLDQLLASKKVKLVIGAQGAIAFAGWTEEDRGRVSDLCAYRRIMTTGSALARAEIARAEQMSGRTVNKQVIGQGVHSHDGGRTFHPGHKH